MLSKKTSYRIFWTSLILIFAITVSAIFIKIESDILGYFLVVAGIAFVVFCAVQVYQLKGDQSVLDILKVYIKKAAINSVIFFIFLYLFRGDDTVGQVANNALGIAWLCSLIDVWDKAQRNRPRED